ncbi:recombinase family protein [Arcanobacterium buesumense]|uniref:Recombinase family protein n=1 Tax=Arcanobacterium buesumense TaxID=2722751 RepID=A0A6H2ELJ3_9ACTO|nr:recombinase family protein [Arcanobacterium buesumense]QJC21946.1 recombinase family protein [Arcanobacterium buesumense]
MWLPCTCECEVRPVEQTSCRGISTTNSQFTNQHDEHARNTVDSLTTVRQLKEAGVEVYFEKENIYTFDSKGELLITIMSSLAQEESRSISENVTWGHRKRFAQGKAMIPYSSLLGYTKGQDGNIQIDEDQAITVRRIYAEFLSGKTPSAIATSLTRLGMPTPRGKTRWCASTVRSILRNEKYKGDALLQKTITLDFLSKTVKKNEGEVTQYYVTGHHPPIIDPDVWDRVQTQFTQRSIAYSNPHHVFSSKIRCGQCQGSFGRKKWHSGTKYERFIWRCNNKYEGKHTRCSTPHVTDEQIRQAFTYALKERVTHHDGTDYVLNILQSTVLNTNQLEYQRDQLACEIDEVTILINQLLNTAATNMMDADNYDTQYATLERRREKAITKYTNVIDEIAHRQSRLAQARAVHDYFASQSPLEYSDDAWNLLVNHAVVDEHGSIHVVFNKAQEQYVIASKG